MPTIITICVVIIAAIVLYNNKHLLSSAASTTWSIVQIEWYLLVLLAAGTIVYGVGYLIFFTLGWIK